MDASTEPRRSSRVTPAQVIALGLVAASIGWAAWVLRDRPTSEEVELLPGTVLPSSELAIVEAAFDRAQLTGHRTEDGRVWVPRPRQSAYMRALVDAEALPREFGSSLRRALESNSPWQSRAAQEELLRVAVQEELAHVICSMPGIERAAVLYDVDDRAAFDGTLGGGPTRTASVNVRTQPDVELEPPRVQAIRVLVAASIAGLEPERVAVTDLRSGRVHAGPLQPVEPVEPPSTADPGLARQIAHERHLVAKVRQGLAFVKGAVVDVTVSFAAAAAAPPAAEPQLPPRQQRVADANAPAEVAVAVERRPPPRSPRRRATAASSRSSCRSRCPRPGSTRPSGPRGSGIRRPPRQRSIAVKRSGFAGTCSNCSRRSRGPKPAAWRSRGFPLCRRGPSRPPARMPRPRRPPRRPRLRVRRRPAAPRRSPAPSARTSTRPSRPSPKDASATCPARSGSH